MLYPAYIHMKAFLLIQEMIRSECILHMFWRALVQSWAMTLKTVSVVWLRLNPGWPSHKMQLYTVHHGWEGGKLCYSSQSSSSRTESTDVPQSCWPSELWLHFGRGLEALSLPDIYLTQSKHPLTWKAPVWQTLQTAGEVQTDLLHTKTLLPLRHQIKHASPPSYATSWTSPRHFGVVDSKVSPFQ